MTSRSEKWGPSPRPGASITPEALGRQFVPRRMGSWPSPFTGAPSSLGGKYVLVLPYEIDVVAITAVAR